MSECLREIVLCNLAEFEQQRGVWDAYSMLESWFQRKYSWVFTGSNHNSHSFFMIFALLNLKYVYIKSEIQLCSMCISHQKVRASSKYFSHTLYVSQKMSNKPWLKKTAKVDVRLVFFLDLCKLFNKKITDILNISWPSLSTRNNFSLSVIN